MLEVNTFSVSVCRSVQESSGRDPPRGLSLCPTRITQPLPQLHQIHPWSHYQSADADLSWHQVSHEFLLLHSVKVRANLLQLYVYVEVLVLLSWAQTSSHEQETIPLFVLKLNSQYLYAQFWYVGQCFIFLHSRNLLSVLPKYLFNLPLKVLLVSNNKLVSIPEEIGKAKELMELVSVA